MVIHVKHVRHVVLKKEIFVASKTSDRGLVRPVINKRKQASLLRLLVSFLVIYCLFGV